MKSVKVIIFGALMLTGQCVVADDSISCQLATEDILKIVTNAKYSGNFWPAFYASADAKKALGSSKLYADYVELMESELTADQKKADPIYSQYKAESSRVEAQMDSVYADLAQRIRKDPIYQEAARRSLKECGRVVELEQMMGR